MATEYKVSIAIEASSNFKKLTDDMDKQLAKLDKRTKQYTATVDKQVAAYNRLDRSLNRLAFIAIPAVTLALNKQWKEFKRYDAAVQDFSALTGITGDRLDGLTNKAEMLSVKWGLAADDIVAGMKRIASNKSEFIEMEGAIETVAEGAAMLSRASGLSFLQTGEFITATMNQFDMGVEDTDRIIHSFAAGAKLGSFEMDRIAQAFARSGGAMRAAGLEYEEALTAVMIGSRIGLTGQMVGTQLKTGMMRLAAVNDIFNPIEVGFEQALANLAARQPTAQEMMSLFGLESLQVSQALIESMNDLYPVFREGIVGTTIAQEQADRQMLSMQARIDALVQTYNRLTRNWFRRESVVTAMERSLEIIDAFLDQTDPKIIQITKGAKYLAITLASVFAITKAVAFIKVMIDVVSMTKAAASWVVGIHTTLSKIHFVGGALSRMPIFGPVFAAVKPLLIIYGVFVAVKGIWDGIAQASSLIREDSETIAELWKLDPFLAVEKVFRRIYGVVSQIANKIMMGIVEPFAWVERKTGKNIFGAQAYKEYLTKTSGEIDDFMGKQLKEERDQKEYEEWRKRQATISNTNAMIERQQQSYRERLDANLESIGKTVDDVATGKSIRDSLDIEIGLPDGLTGHVIHNSGDHPVRVRQRGSTSFGVWGAERGIAY